MFSYTKLKEGDWGLRYIGVDQFDAGARVQVHTKAGAIKSETLGKMIWSGTDRDGQSVSLYLIHKDAPPETEPPRPTEDSDESDWSGFE